jgi:hypothetical protein
MAIRHSSRIVISLALVFGMVQVASTQRRRYERREARWEFLGQAHVDGRTDHDRIRVDNPGSFTALQLGVRDGAIEFHRVVVHFDNGEDHQVELRERIAANQKSRVIDLPGNRRRIRSVEFWYGKSNWRTRPAVNLWGRR